MWLSTLVKSGWHAGSFPCILGTCLYTTWVNHGNMAEYWNGKFDFFTFFTHFKSIAPGGKIPWNPIYHTKYLSLSLSLSLSPISLSSISFYHSLISLFGSTSNCLCLFRSLCLSLCVQEDRAKIVKPEVSETDVYLSSHHPCALYEPSPPPSWPWNSLNGSNLI